MSMMNGLADKIWGDSTPQGRVLGVAMDAVMAFEKEPASLAGANDDVNQILSAAS
jgi:hypothetical protein